jgi:outer membrane lipoprotein SlyB
MTTMTNETPAIPAPRKAGLRTAWMVGGGLTIAAAGVAAGLALRPAPSAPPVPVSASMAPDESVVEPARVSDKAAAETMDSKVADARPVPAKAHATPARRAPATPRAPAQYASNEPTPLATQPAAVCTTCGVIEGVRAVEQKGPGTGLGAVAGGVAGAAVGNQFGHGSGRAVMTVLGAVGGGLAGNEIEKNVRKETVYEVRVRMDDGSVRTLMQKTAPTPGARVTVEGNELQTMRAPQGEGRMVRTSSGT